MMNAFQRYAVLSRQVLSSIFLIIAALVLTGCSISAPQAPVASQQADLLDNDSDGVINARDNCEGTPAGAVINNDGCSEEFEISARDDLHILFANDSSRIPASFIGEVNDLASFMKSFSSIVVELKGYASIIGEPDYNLTLSERRSKAVKSALIEQGIIPDRVRIVGYGEAEPVEAQTQEQSDILSRRVTASVKVSETDIVKKWTIYTTSPEDE
ncbi:MULTISPECIES: OmpA family protein [Grimontia]|uniref:Outer membrane porin F n=1 Tax=Grimontia marina TaxID=646534 RepID=A0A128F7Q1_9GAMM|nr:MULTISPECIES: OmpA family protein [Grimontia]WRV98110.1 OmpA family protein [Grimontia sp. NTOU-MAR1]CZF82520.1 Outer membrane porin F precursor [Grimontia marina]